MTRENAENPEVFGRQSQDSADAPKALRGTSEEWPFVGKTKRWDCL